MKIVSGGQTGVDRGALDIALEWHVSCGGWCPKGRRAEDGYIPEKYPLQESRQSNYNERTFLNIRDSDGTLVLKRGKLKGGTALTVKLAQKVQKPVWIVDLDLPIDFLGLEKWICDNAISVINIAGPRESQQQGIYEQAKQFLLKVKNILIK